MKRKRWTPGLKRYPNLVKMLKKFTTQNMGYGETHRYKQPVINFLLNITNGARHIKIKKIKTRGMRRRGGKVTNINVAAHYSPVFINFRNSNIPFSLIL